MFPNETPKKLEPVFALASRLFGKEYWRVANNSRNQCGILRTEFEMLESLFVLFGQSISSVLQFQQLGGFKYRSIPFQVGCIQCKYSYICTDVSAKEYIHVYTYKSYKSYPGVASETHSAAQCWQIQRGIPRPKKSWFPSSRSKYREKGALYKRSVPGTAC